MQRIPERGGFEAVPFFRFGPALLLAIALGACASPPTDTLASWPGGEVTADELDGMVRSLPASQRQPGEGESLTEWIGARAGDLALNEILQQRDAGDETAIPPELELRARYEAGQEIGRGYLARHCAVPEISPEELADLYAGAFPRESQEWILVRHIYKRSLPGEPASERAATRRELEELRSELTTGASFVELARLHSDSETAKDGGLIGRLSREAPVELRVRDAAWALGDGGYSQIIEVDNGFHLLWRERSGVTQRPSLEQVKAELTQAEGLRRREACGQEILTQLSAQSPVIIDRDALLTPDDETRVALQVGTETFTARQLNGLSSDFSPLVLTPRPGELLRHFSEAVLLVDAAVSEDPALAETVDTAQDRARRRLSAESRWRQERQRLVAQRPERELRAFFEQNIDRFQTDLELDVGLITVGSEGRPGRRPAMERALALRRQLTADTAFEDLASKVSEHESRADAGRLGSLPLPRLRVILGSRGAASAAELAIGEVSPPVLIHDPPAAAFALIKLYARTEPQPRSFAEAREEVIATQSQENIRQLDREVREMILAEAEFKLHAKAIEDYIARLRG